MVWLPDSPAFAGIRPPELVWATLNPSVLIKAHPAWRQFQNTFPQVSGSDLVIERLQTAHNAPYGFYRLRRGTHDWFVKLVPTHGARRQAQAQGVADFLSEQGIAVPKLLDGFPCDLTDQVSALGYDYYPGRFSDYSQSDLRRIGHTIGQVHRALTCFPESEVVKQAAIHRKTMLCERWQRLLQCPDQMQSLPEAGQAILRTHSPEWLWHLMENGQMVHGDLNVGNLWFADSGELMVLDWEDSLTAWFDPLKDLAFVIERFVLTVHDASELAHRSHDLLDAYFEINPVTIQSDSRFVDLLQALATRSLLILAESQASGNAKPAESEWQKFCFLYKLTQQYEEPLKQIAAPFVARQDG
ncbi:hypothetical protein AVO41_08905 [Thiomicrospira sp. WB1]|nr:hypothetical protein AVO41_08905 [Thiomicrospira sp. WB1]